MTVAARALFASGAAAISVGMVGAGVVSVSPVGAPLFDDRTSTEAYILTASSVLNIPLNIVNMVLSIPAWEIQAMNRLADAMIGTGSWQVWGPTNVFGFDEWDPPKLAGVIDMMIPIQPFSSVLGNQLNTWAKANLPMRAGCAALPGACPDLGDLLGNMFKAPFLQLVNGYQLPAVINPFTLKPTSWSGQYLKIEPGAAFTSLWNYLTGDPKGVQLPSLNDLFAVPLKLAKSILDGFYPFVQNSEWFNPNQSLLALGFRALAPLLCPSCGPEPYSNPSLDANYPPKPASAEATEPTVLTRAAETPVAAVAQKPAPAGALGTVATPETAATPATVPIPETATDAAETPVAAGAQQKPASAAALGTAAPVVKEAPSATAATVETAVPADIAETPVPSARRQESALAATASGTVADGAPVDSSTPAPPSSAVASVRMSAPPSFARLPESSASAVAATAPTAAASQVAASATPARNSLDAEPATHRAERGGDNSSAGANATTTTARGDAGSSEAE
jgi:hypothetical protein